MQRTSARGRMLVGFAFTLLVANLAACSNHRPTTMTPSAGNSGGGSGTASQAGSGAGTGIGTAGASGTGASGTGTSGTGASGTGAAGGSAGTVGGSAGSSAQDAGSAACTQQCPVGQHCELVQVMCIRAPCPPQPSCVADASLDGGAANDCDQRKVLCKIGQPICLTGTVPSVSGTCYGNCVPIESCVCTEAAACPDSNQYTCHMSARRCGPYI